MAEAWGTEAERLEAVQSALGTRADGAVLVAVRSTIAVFVRWVTSVWARCSHGCWRRSEISDACA